MNEVHQARRCNSQMSSALYCTPKVQNSVANVRVISQPGGRCCSKVAWSCRRQTVELPVPGESRATRQLRTLDMQGEIQLQHCRRSGSYVVRQFESRLQAAHTSTDGALYSHLTAEG